MAHVTLVHYAIGFVRIYIILICLYKRCPTLSELFFLYILSYFNNNNFAGGCFAGGVSKPFVKMSQRGMKYG